MWTRDARYLYEMERSLILVACAAVYGLVSFVVFIYCCRVLLKFTKKYDEEERSEPMSKVTELSEFCASVCEEETRITNINEGCFNSGMETCSSGDQKEDDQVSQKPPFINEEYMFIQHESSQTNRAREASEEGCARVDCNGSAVRF